MADARVAVVGATGLVGREIVEVLASRQFPLAELELYASMRSAGEAVTCGDLSPTVQLLDSAVFDDVDIVILAAGEQVSAEWAGRLDESNAMVIDMSQLHAFDSEVLPVVPEVNAVDLGEGIARGVVSSPDAITVALSVVLGPLRDALGLRSVTVTTFEPVSGVGRTGVDELQQQTISLIGGDSTEAAKFPQRIAFNVFPHVGEFLDGGSTKDETVTASNLRRVLDSPDVPISCTRVRVPLFFGQAMSVHLESIEPADAEEVRNLLRAAPGLLLQDDLKESLYPTPANAVGEDSTFVGRIRCDPHTQTIDLWAVADNIRKGSAVNAVQIAELIARDYL